MSRMFPHVTRTWNPVVGCPYRCRYCWARRLAQTRLKHMYKDFTKPRFYPERLKKIPKKGTVFVCSMGDLFSYAVPDSWIRSVFKAIIDSGSEATFLFLTKNPMRYFRYIDLYRSNMVFGATIETSFSIGFRYSDYSGAPWPSARISYMRALRHKYDFLRLFISIEPVMKFYDTHEFVDLILSIEPEFVYIGYDNYNNGLPEPPHRNVEMLIELLRNNGVEVRPKASIDKRRKEV